MCLGRAKLKEVALIKDIFSIMLCSVCEFNFEVNPRTATKFLSLLLPCVALGSDTQGTHKEQNLFFVRHARE